MRQCTYCGKSYPDEAEVCALDGQPLRPESAAPATPPPLSSPERQQVVDGEHVRMLSIFHFVVAGLALLGMLFTVAHFLMMNSLFSHPELWKGQNSPNPMPNDFWKVFIWFYLVFGVALATACVLNILSAIFLRQRKHRVFSLVVGGLNCLQIPFGTVLGAFTLIVLSRDSVRQMYARWPAPGTLL